MNAMIIVLMVYFPSYNPGIHAHHNSVPISINGFQTMEACEAAAEQFRNQKWPIVKGAICYSFPSGSVK